MKQSRIIALIAFAMLAVVPVASAVDFGVRAGRYNDADENFVGAELAIDLGKVTLNPNVEYYYDIENATVGSANLDLTIDIGAFPAVTPYVGVGAGLGYVDTDFGGSDTNLLGNAIGGVRFNLAFLKPYAQAKWVRDFDKGGGNDWAITVGLRF
jgi:hypothetical protein